MRSAATALVCLFVAGQAAVQVHQVQVTHVACPEHGELVHAGHEPATDATSDPAPSLHRDPASEDRHDHCDFVFARRDPAAMDDTTACSTVPAPPRTAPGCPGTDDLRTALAPLVVAPKGSPPA